MCLRTCRLICRWTRARVYTACLFGGLCASVCVCFCVCVLLFCSGLLGDGTSWEGWSHSLPFCYPEGSQQGGRDGERWWGLGGRKRGENRRVCGRRISAWDLKGANAIRRNRKRLAAIVERRGSFEPAQDEWRDSWRKVGGERRREGKCVRLNRDRAVELTQPVWSGVGGQQYGKK